MKALLLILSVLSWQGLLQEAKQHYMKYENDSCAVKVAKVREHCLAHPDEEGVLEMSADVENVLGALSQSSGHRDSAAVHYRAAYDFAMRLDDRSKAPMYCINIADILRQVGNAPEAAHWLRRALTLSDSLSVHDLDCAINTQLGQIYSDLRNTPMSERYFNAAENSCIPGSFDDYFLANARGNACFFNEDYSEAVNFFRRASKAAGQTGNEYNVKITEVNLGECFLSLHRLDSAAFYINASYDFWSGEENCDISILTAIRGLKAGLALERGNVAEAERWLACGNGGPGTSPIYTDAFNRHMMEISVLKGDWKKAYEYSRKKQAYTDSLFRSTLEANFAEAEIRYSRDTTVLHQRLRISAQQERIFSMEVWIAFLILSLVLCSEIIIRVQRARKKERLYTEETIQKLKLENIKHTSGTQKVCIDNLTEKMYVTADEMVLFTYQSDSRKWDVLLKDGTKATMKRGSHAEQILALSPSFTKLKSDSIVNMDYIRSIGAKDQRCTLVEPFSDMTLYFSRRSAKMAKEYGKGPAVLRDEKQI